MNGSRKRSLGGEAVYDGEYGVEGERRHNQLSEETKVVVSGELKTYLITHQVRLLTYYCIYTSFLTYTCLYLFLYVYSPNH